MEDPMLPLLRGFNLNREPSKPVQRFGYLVEDSKDAKWDDWMKKNPHVAGMAVGQGANGDNRPDRAIVVNPYNPYMSDPAKRNALIRLEAARHLMEEKKLKYDFPITPEMQAWRQVRFKKGVDPYADDDNAFRETVISRALVGDDHPTLPDNEYVRLRILNKELDKRDSKTSVSRMFSVDKPTSKSLTRLAGGGSERAL
jgi:hypothetical protein